MEIGIDPVIFDLSFLPAPMRWYGVMIFIAVATVCTFTFIRARKKGFQPDEMYMFLTFALLGALIGARMVHVIDRWDDLYKDDLSAIFLSWGGMGAHGAILGSIAGGWIYAAYKKFPMGLLCNLAVPGAALALAIARIGCTIDGCCYGSETSLPWAITYTHWNSVATLGVAVHPTQIYELLWCLGLFALIWWKLRFIFTKDWTLALLFLCLYSVGRFFIFILRDNETFFLGLKEGQVIALVTILICLPLLIYFQRKPVPEVTSNHPDNGTLTGDS